MAYREVETLITLKGLAGKRKMVITLLKGQALSYFEYHLEYMPKNAIQVHKYYMRIGIVWEEYESAKLCREAQ
jgi:hypothetical protein